VQPHDDVVRSASGLAIAGPLAASAVQSVPPSTTHHDSNLARVAPAVHHGGSVLFISVHRRTVLGRQLAARREADWWRNGS
jgi:hypothetical protein